MDFLRKQLIATLWSKATDPDEAKHRHEICQCRDVDAKLSVLLSFVHGRFQADVRDGEVRNNAGEEEMFTWMKRRYPDFRGAIISIGSGGS